MSLHNVINIKTKEPVKAIRKRYNKVTVPELQTKESIQQLLDDLRSGSHNVDELVIFGKYFDGGYFQNVVESSNETRLMAGRYISNIEFENV